MGTDNRRIVMDRGFDAAVEAVVTSFVREGFTITPLDGGDLRRHLLPDDPLRYAVLVASLPEFGFAADRFGRADGAILASRITVYELVSSCTLVTVDTPLDEYPLLASIVPAIARRAGTALRAIANASVPPSRIETGTA